MQERAPLHVGDVQPQGSLVPDDGEQTIERPTEQLRCVGFDAAQQSQDRTQIDTQNVEWQAKSRRNSCTCTQRSARLISRPEQILIEQPRGSTPGQQLSLSRSWLHTRCVACIHSAMHLGCSLCFGRVFQNCVANRRAAHIVRLLSRLPNQFDAGVSR